jgi:SAM-dependent methyltransferase
MEHESRRAVKTNDNPGPPALNRKQADFFDTAPAQRRLNLAMKLWRRVRGDLYFLMVNSGIWEDVFDLHKRWMGDLAGKKVLDLGCNEGNVLSPYLAAHAGQYLGIDLSRNALDKLDDHFRKAGILNARLQCVDALSSEFTESGFDIIYAQGVLHHFKPIGPILGVLREKLAAGGRIVSCDPVQTSLLACAVRTVYHPFRADREWEWPFTRETFAEIKTHFRIRAVQGVIGCSKWAIPMAALHRPTALRWARKLHEKDLRLATGEHGHLWRCLQITMCLEV